MDLDALGMFRWRTWKARLRLVVAASWLPNVALALALTSDLLLFHKPPPHHCQPDPALLPPTLRSLAGRALLNVSLPRLPFTNSWSPCLLLQYPGPDPKPNGTRPCTRGWEFARPAAGLLSTPIIQWNLVCENGWKVPLEQISFLLSWLSGCVILGSACDWYGRRVVFVLSLTLATVLGLGVTLSISYPMLLSLRMLYGASVAGAFLSLYVTRLEICDPNHRLPATMVANLFFVAGTVSVPELAAVCQDWRLLEGLVTFILGLLLLFWGGQKLDISLLLFVLLSPSSRSFVILIPDFIICSSALTRKLPVIAWLPKLTDSCPVCRIRHCAAPSYRLSLLLFPFLLPESPRWLVATRQLERAQRVLWHMAESNFSPAESSSVNLAVDAGLDRLFAMKPLPQYHCICKIFSTQTTWRNILILSFTTWSLPRLTPQPPLPPLRLEVSLAPKPHPASFPHRFLGYGIRYNFTQHLMPHLPSMDTASFLLAGLEGAASLLLIPMACCYGRRANLLLWTVIISVVSLFLLSLSQDLPVWMVMFLSGLGLLASQAISVLSIFFSSEILPTVLRGGGLGVILAAGFLGQVTTPITSFSRTPSFFLHHLVFASFAVLSMLCILLLPESQGRTLPDTLEDAEGRQSSLLFLPCWTPQDPHVPLLLPHHQQTHYGQRQLFRSGTLGSNPENGGERHESIWNILGTRALGTRGARRVQATEQHPQ
ncbi:putative solute carrier family 22 member 31 [Sarcophilus harrisii]